MRPLPTLFALFSLLAILVGCGGGAGSGPKTAAGRGSATITVAWPTQARVIPAVAQSIRITLTPTTGNPAPIVKTIVRPDASVQFDGLDPKVYVVTGEAFRETSPSAGSVPLSRGSSDLQIFANATATFSVTMDTTIDRFEVDGLSPSLPVFYLTGLGAVDASGAALPSVPSYPFDQTSRTLTITPQSRVGAGYSNLLLLPDASSPTQTTLTAAVAPPLVAAFDSSDSASLRLVVSLPSGSTEGDSSLSVVYNEPNAAGTGVNVLTFRTPISVSNGATTSVAPRATGIPVTVDDGLFQVHATIQETSTNLGRQSSTQDFPVLTGASAVTMDFGTAFSDDGGQYKLTAELQVKTNGPGYITVATKTSSGKLTELGDVTFARSTDSPNIKVNASQTFSVARGDATPVSVTAVQATVGSANVPASLPAALFDFKNVAASAANRISLSYNSTTKAWELKAPTSGSSSSLGSGTFEVYLHGESARRATLSYTITANGGGVVVGIG